MGDKQRRVRELRLKDFVAESLREIANHSSEPGALHRAADAVAASTDQTMVTILEELNAPENEPSVYAKRGIIFLEP